MSAFYNEIDAKTAAWLRELGNRNLFPNGPVVEKSITELHGNEIKDYTQVHLFAGIGGWAYALRLAGWPDSLPVWTGSCPCQPFSVAGKGLGTDDPRHLWPHMRRLIEECRPPIVFGEQVASKAGREWLAGVRADMEALGYAFGASDLCAASVGSPNIRQRLYWVAHATGSRYNDTWQGVLGTRRKTVRPSNGCQTGGMEHASVHGCDTAKEGLNKNGPERSLGEIHEHRQTVRAGASGGMGDPNIQEPQGWSEHAGEYTNQRAPWRASEPCFCADGKTRRIESGTFPLVAGIPGGVVPSGDPSVPYAQATSEARTMRLRGYGNSIVPQLAAEFIQASIEAILETQ